VPRRELVAFHRSLRNLDYTRKRMEDLYDDAKIRKRDLDSVYEALFLRAVTSFESFLEELFLGIMEGRVRYSSTSGVSRRMTTKSREALVEIVFQGKNKYLNWLPFQHTEDRAGLYLREGKPFSSLEDGDRSVVKTITLIRHAIAHRSKHSMDEFRTKVLGSLSLLKGERTPAGFLRSRVHSGGNRFEAYVGVLGKIAAILC
jgi:hypothetical protein